MMRARNIKPGFFKNEELAECDPMARLLFIGLWCLADREGRLEDRPKKIKMEVFPADSCDCDELLNQLERHELIRRYSVYGSLYILIPAFLKHQRPHSNEAQSEIPPIEQAGHSKNTKTFNQSEKDFRPRKEALRSDSLNPDSLNPDSLNPDSLNADSCADPSRAPAPEPDPVLLCIPTNRFEKSKEEYEVKSSLVTELQELYPSVDVMQSLRAIRAWNLTNPAKRKTLQGIPKHINAWLSKEQNNGKREINNQPRLVSPVTERNMAVIRAAREREKQNG